MIDQKMYSKYQRVINVDQRYIYIAVSMAIKILGAFDIKNDCNP